MFESNVVKKLSDISLALFRKNFFGIYHGSISKKIEHNSFVINKKDAIFDEIDESSLCELHLNQKDYSWKIASMEAQIHNNIYTEIHEAKYIACGMPPYATAFSLEYEEFELQDYFGKTIFGKIAVHDPGDFNTWYKRNYAEIPILLKLSKNNILVIKGVGVYVYDRDMNDLVKKVAILENSCRLLAIQKQISSCK
ncbi:MAG: class II aldolase/adducin family protein [Campylobacterales bacterium]|nr:class II aldolase/adducin family protein [Campylobacterales bacterium]